MNRSFCAFLVVIVFLLFVGSANSKILVIAPHPDDDILIAAGVTYAATQRGEQVSIVYVTNGDNLGIAIGNLRQDEAVNAQTLNLGTRESDLIFLGYPDGGLQSMYVNYPKESDRFLTANNGQIVTYANRGLGGTDYHNFRYREHANYNGYNLVKDLKDIIDTLRPDHIVTVAEFDGHPDHTTTYRAIRDAILAITALDPNYLPVLNTSLVWSSNSSIWPSLLDPLSYFSEPPGLIGTGFDWAKRESLDVPLAMQVTDSSNIKRRAISDHASQDSGLDRFVHKDEFFWSVSLNNTNLPPIVNAGMDQTVTQDTPVLLNGAASFDPNGTVLAYRWRQVNSPLVTLLNSSTATPSFLAPTGAPIDITLAFELIVDDGVFDTLPDHVSVRVPSSSQLPNIASLATVTASSQNNATNQQAVKAVDGRVDGCCSGDSSKEWATVGQGAGAWIQLNWTSPYEVYRVVLHDRPNLNDMIMSATITFSSGASTTVGALDNGGDGVEFIVGPFITNSLRVTVLTASGGTKNVGLSELEVYGALPAGGNLAPVANAGPDQVAAQGVLVNLDGNGSTDPNGDVVIGYQWTQIAGPSVLLVGANTAMPSFKTPGGLTATTLLTFALTVNDGQLNSAPDPVNVNVNAPLNSGNNIATLATITSSSQNFGTNQLAIKAIDGVVDGWPGDYTREWATISGISGSWLELNWSSAYQINQVVLFDRPNLSDQITSATLNFSDGATITTGALDNAGSGIIINFTPLIANRLRVTVTTVSGATVNVGLSEIEVYGIPPAGGNQAPVANAGPDQTVTAGSEVFLDGRVSSDINNNPLAYQWMQTAGPTINLSNATTSTPNFTVPSGLLTTTVMSFALIVNDGQLTSVADSVNVMVNAASGSVNNVAQLASVTASSQNVGSNQLALNVIDGVIDGYPGDYTKEWATSNERAGSWLELNWSNSYSVNQVVLYDRPNSNDQVTSATLTFSDGSVVTVGELSNTGTAVVVNFAPVVTNKVRVTVNTVSGSTINIGLSEFQVYGF
jgi:LmbE family N-acetylglucosaminyl deacetylase